MWLRGGSGQGASESQTPWTWQDAVLKGDDGQTDGLGGGGVEAAPDALL